MGDGDEKSGGKSALKALGSGNPTTVGVSGEVFSGTFTVQGGKYNSRSRSRRTKITDRKNNVLNITIKRG